MKNLLIAIFLIAGWNMNAQDFGYKSSHKAETGKGKTIVLTFKNQQDKWGEKSKMGAPKYREQPKNIQVEKDFLPTENYKQSNKKAAVKTAANKPKQDS